MNYRLRDKRNRNERLYRFWQEHRDWTYISIGAVFHISGVRAWQIIKKLGNAQQASPEPQGQEFSPRLVADDSGVSEGVQNNIGGKL